MDRVVLVGSVPLPWGECIEKGFASIAPLDRDRAVKYVALEHVGQD